MRNIFVFTGWVQIILWISVANTNPVWLCGNKHMWGLWWRGMLMAGRSFGYLVNLPAWVPSVPIFGDWRLPVSWEVTWLLGHRMEDLNVFLGFFLPDFLAVLWRWQNPTSKYFKCIKWSTWNHKVEQVLLTILPDSLQVHVPFLCAHFPDFVCSVLDLSVSPEFCPCLWKPCPAGWKLEVYVFCTPLGNERLLPAFETQPHWL
jgi:hypothetical protein